MSPRVSVVMAVYNGEKYLREALDSILAQTFTDFEFIIVNDGSTDATSQIIEEFDDDRIRLIQNQLNIGLTLSLNRGLEVATGEYIARMDCDDISLPVRLAKQVAFMDANQQVGACGTWALEIDGSGKIIGKRETLVGRQLDNFYWRTSLIHSTSMFRFTPSCGPWYDPALKFSQDYDLWLRISTERKLNNLAEHLLLYRVHDESITAANSANQMNSAYRSFSKHIGEGVISFEAFKALMGYSYAVQPIQRIFATRRLAKRLSKPYRTFLNDDVEYLRHWARLHGSAAQSFEALAFRALGYIKRQTSFRLI